MIQSEILQERDTIQKKLSGESGSIREYLMRSHLAAKEIAALHGFHLQYAQMPYRKLKGNHSSYPPPAMEWKERVSVRG